MKLSPSKIRSIKKVLIECVKISNRSIIKQRTKKHIVIRMTALIHWHLRDVVASESVL